MSPPPPRIASGVPGDHRPPGSVPLNISTMNSRCHVASVESRAARRMWAFSSSDNLGLEGPADTPTAAPAHNATKAAVRTVRGTQQKLAVKLEFTRDASNPGPVHWLDRRRPLHHVRRLASTKSVELGNEVERREGASGDRAQARAAPSSN